jgi:radical SAM superfamily enzyme YgiQ (UPF0313 family)
MRSAKNFIDEVEVNYKDFQIREFDIYDSSFTIDKQRVLEICDEILKRKLRVFWTARSRIDNVDKDLLKAMSMAGCNTLMYGIENADHDILDVLKKPINIDMVRDIVRYTNNCGIKTLGFFMVGSPGDTQETIKRTIDFSIELDLDYVQFTKTTAFANTELYQRYIQEYGDDYWREFTLNPDTEKELPLVGTKITVKEALRWVRWAYICFFFRFRYIYKAIKRLGSWLEFKNEVRAALCMIFYRQ